MHWVIFCMAATCVIGELSTHDESELHTTDYEYTAYDTELKSPAITSRRVARKTNDKHETQVTHRQVEIILTEPTIVTTTNEERKLRYNEKVYLPEVRGVENATVEPHQVFKNNISVALMGATKSYRKDAWDRICQPLTGTAHPDGIVNYIYCVSSLSLRTLYKSFCIVILTEVLHNGLLYVCFGSLTSFIKFQLNLAIKQAFIVCYF